MRNAILLLLILSAVNARLTVAETIVPDQISDGVASEAKFDFDNYKADSGVVTNFYPIVVNSQNKSLLTLNCNGTLIYRGREVASNDKELADSLRGLLGCKGVKAKVKNA